MPSTFEHRSSEHASWRSPRSTSASNASRATQASCVRSASTARTIRPTEVVDFLASRAVAVGLMFTPVAAAVCMPVATPTAAADTDAADFFLALVPPLAPSIAAALLFWRFAVLPIAATQSCPGLSRDASP